MTQRSVLSKPRGLDGRAAGLLFVVPAISLIAFCVYAPLVQSVRYSFTKWDGVSPPVGVGLDNYRTLLDSPQFHEVLRNELLLLAGIVVWIAVPFMLAVVTHGMRHAGLIRTALFIPLLLPPVVAANTFRLVLADDGPLNGMLRAIGLDALALGWLTDGNAVHLSVVLVIAWAVMGGGLMFYSTALTSLPLSREEAARLDGASWWQLVWHIYRPHLRPVTRFWTLVLIALSLTAFFPWIYSLTRGGPGISSTTLDYHVYTTGIQNAQQGLAAAIGVVNVLLAAVLFSGWLLLKKVVRTDA